MLTVLEIINVFFENINWKLIIQRLLKIELVSRESLNILMMKLKRRNEEKWDGND